MKNNMFKIFKRVAELEKELDCLKRDHAHKTKATGIAIVALEDYLDIEFFHGDKNTPHYRKKRVIKKPVGRPRKKK